MGRVRTRSEKFKEYREEIYRTEETLEREELKKSTQSVTILKPKKEVKKHEKKRTEPVINKHAYKVKEEKKEKPIVQKTVYDEYKKIKTRKSLLYAFFVILFIGFLVFLLLFVGNEFLGFNIW